MILHGDSLEVLKTLDADSVDAVVTDPPYGLSFMGKKWDYDVPNIDLWRSVYRVLKPGGHLLSFGGTRTYHRLVVAIEESGFDIRDQIQWIYGSGFPKSLDIGKAIDKSAGVIRDVIGKGKPMSSLGVMHDDEWKSDSEYNLTAPATPDAIRWQGFGTALKPANEPIVLARKPLSESTVAKNVLKHGTGALNIDGTRIAGNVDEMKGRSGTSGVPGGDTTSFRAHNSEGGVWEPNTQGRWPANVLFDEEAAAMLDEQSGMLKSGGASRFFYVAKASKRERNAGLEGMPEKRSGHQPLRQCVVCKGWNVTANGKRCECESPTFQDKAQANHHPTVKPIKLMEYLCTLICPPGGTVLDPFAGSGSTLVAAKRLGFKFIGIERELEYVRIAERRVAHVEG